MYNFDTYKSLLEIENLKRIIIQTKEQLEGNCLYTHRNINKYNYEEKENLRYNIYTLCNNIDNIMEIGFNGGHSVVLYNYSNPNIKVTTFDICYHKYTQKCVDYLQSLDKYNINFIKGDSTKTVLEHDTSNKYDIIHIDGGHSHEVAEQDIKNCKKHSKENTILIIDDAYAPQIERLISKYIKDRLFKEIDYDALKLKPTKYHRMFNYL
jgi:predicted O-methyltransferase YrrM